jgi:hypothetical protein
VVVLTLAAAFNKTASLFRVIPEKAFVSVEFAIDGRFLDVHNRGNFSRVSEYLLVVRRFKSRF